jgi:hypothetical protein
MRASFLRALWAAGAALASVSASGDARACGGCFHPPSMSGTVVTDHRMIFSVSPQQTTLYDQIEYTGSPTDFAWVLPIKGVVTVGVSSDVLFSTMDAATQTTIVAPALPPCPSCNRGVGVPALVAGPNGAMSAGGSAEHSVTVLSQSVVGPYEQVQLQSADPQALQSWLAAHGYALPASIEPIVAAYVSDGFDFLAMRLQPGQGVQAMRPISVTTPGAGVTLPLRMVAAGTGATVGVTLWVVATGRYEPANFETFTMSGADLTWDFAANESDYATQRASKEAALMNAGWQVESSLSIDPFEIESPILADPAASDYLSAAPATGDDAGAAVDGGDPDSGASAAAARAKDLATCFPGGPAAVRITRMRADLSHAALTHDLVLQAASDQSALSNVYTCARWTNAPVCPKLDPFSCLAAAQDAEGGAASQGCAAAAALDSRRSEVESVIACLAALAVAGSRRRRRHSA